MRRILFHFATIAIVIGCAALAAAPVAVPKKPSAPKVIDFQGVPTFTWTYAVSLATVTSWTRQEINQGSGFVIVTATCTSGGASLTNCQAPAPVQTKGTYSVTVRACDTQGAAIKCTEGPSASLDVLPAPVAPSAPGCIGCTVPTPTARLLPAGGFDVSRGIRDSERRLR